MPLPVWCLKSLSRYIYFSTVSSQRLQFGLINWFNLVSIGHEDRALSIVHSISTLTVTRQEAIECTKHTARLDTIFSHIYLLVRQISQKFQTLWLKCGLYHFFSYKPTKVTSDIILNHLKKSYRGYHPSVASLQFLHFLLPCN